MTATPNGEDTAADTPTTKRQAIRDGIDNVRTQASEKAHSALSQAKDGVDHAKTAVKDGVDHARSTVGDAYANSRTKMTESYAVARAKAKGAGQQAIEGVENNPISVLAAGIAIGAVIGALIPRSEQEKKALAPLGEKLNLIAREALGAAKDAGQDKLDELGLTREKARETVKSLLDGALAAATTAGTAAVDKAKAGRKAG